MIFKRLTEYWNSDECGTYPTDAATVAKVVTFYSKALANSITDVLFRKEADHYLRVSAMGKPLVLLCLAKIGYREPDNISFKIRWIFMLGHVFEAFVMCVIFLLKYDIHSAQDEIDFGGVKGHIDFMVDETVVEVKTMSDRYFTDFCRKQNDDRGYLTQLHIYCHAKGTKRGVFLVINKSTNELREVPLIWDDRYITRARLVVDHYNACGNIDYIIDNLSAPECVPEKKGMTMTGNFLVPPSMRYSYFRDAFYHWNGQTATYIPHWYRSFE
jgi:hypothetical protein